ncbi:hypothetical protein K7432_008389 [Basidiobolus ranarum]|uniref:RRM domain-containing protein n=1 Tax=Basidiobolus ranarum TaxID=34480 RepID=A0ABR2VYM7_9FUNG
MTNSNQEDHSIPTSASRKGNPIEVPSKFSTSRTRVSTVGTQGLMRRTSMGTRRSITTSTTVETKSLSTTTHQPLQRRTSTTTRITATEPKLLSRTTRTSLGSQETKDSSTRSVSTAGVGSRRTSLVAKGTTNVPSSTLQSIPKNLDGNVEDAKPNIRPTRTSIKETPTQSTTRTRLSTDTHTRSRRTPLVTRKSSIEIRSITAPLTGIEKLNLEKASTIHKETSLKTSNTAQVDTAPNNEGKSSPIKPKNVMSVNITTPRKGAPKRQPRSTARKTRRASFIEGIQNDLSHDIKMKAAAEVDVDVEMVEEKISVQVKNETPIDIKEKVPISGKITEEVPLEVIELAASVPEPVSVAQASLALHAPAANGRKRKAPEQLAITFKKISRNTYIANTIFLSDMPLHMGRHATKELIHEVFGDYTKDIIQERIMISCKNKSSGIAYLTFKSKEAALKAKDVKPKGNMKICLMGSPEHMENTLDTSLDPSSNEYLRNVAIERLLSIYSVLKENGPISTARIQIQLPPPAQSYLTEDGKEQSIGTLFKQRFGNFAKMFMTEPICQVFDIASGTITHKVPTFEEAKEILLGFQTFPLNPPAPQKNIDPPVPQKSAIEQ